MSEDEWTLTDERIAELVAMVEASPCPRSAFCADDVARTRFALHIVADKALRELQHHRAAKRADGERIMAVVREAWWHAMGQHTDESIVEADWSELRDAIASRVASQLAGSIEVGLSESDGSMLVEIRSLVATKNRTDPHWDAELALLDRLIASHRSTP